mmetsp:Transcript_10469/g.29642  ORF Transcript_10469/g.29642 Transcript_10469/m.29642 type:complete len:212 (+) Transcript_10469:2753-3388(+)
MQSEHASFSDCLFVVAQDFQNLHDDELGISLPLLLKAPWKVLQNLQGQYDEVLVRVMQPQSKRSHEAIDVCLHSILSSFSNLLQLFKGSAPHFPIGVAQLVQNSTRKLSVRILFWGLLHLYCHFLGLHEFLWRLLPRGDRDDALVAEICYRAVNVRHDSGLDLAQVRFILQSPVSNDRAQNICSGKPNVRVVVTEMNFDGFNEPLGTHLPS